MIVLSAKEELGVAEAIKLNDSRYHRQIEMESPNLRFAEASIKA
jgi:hypothetical protein